jgi:ligand-binding sensor domain-containing protein
MYGFNPYNNINCLLVEPRTDSIWVAATSGVYILNPSTGMFRPVGGKRYFGTVKQMCHDNEGNLWLIRTEGGLLRFDGKQVIQFDERDGLGSSNLQSLTISGKYAWLGTPNGIDRFDVNMFNQTRQVQVFHLGKADGFTSPECTYLSYTDPQGNLWQGTKTGITRYNPSLPAPMPDTLLLHINEVKLRYETVDWIAYADSLNPFTQLPENLHLQYNENTLTFAFNALYFSNPQLISYQYRLNQNDTAWLPAPPEQIVTYANLPPGHYRFEVRAHHLQNPLAYAQTAFTFAIAPPVWHYWWFWAWLSLALAGVLMLYLSVRFIAARLYRRRMLRRAIQKIHKQG